MYWEVAKSACSSIKRFLIKNELPSINIFDDKDLEYYKFDFMHMRNYSPLLNPGQLYPFQGHLKDDRFFKFSFVRHPYDRVLSAYLDKIVHNRPPSSDLKRILDLDPFADHEISFSTFVHSLKDTPPSSMNSHWRPQYHWLTRGEFPFDFIGRVENIEKDILHVCEKTGLERKFFQKFSPHQTDSAQKRREHYTSELEAIIQQVYKEDFENFGYDS